MRLKQAIQLQRPALINRKCVVLLRTNHVCKVLMPPPFDVCRTLHFLGELQNTIGSVFR